MKKFIFTIVSEQEFSVEGFLIELRLIEIEVSVSNSIEREEINISEPKTWQEDTTADWVPNV